MDMYCRQCEQAAGGKRCAGAIGICGKTAEVAASQDELVHALKGIGWYAHQARELGIKDAGIDSFVADALFTTLTNVNFDEGRIASLVDRSAAVKKQARELFSAAYGAKNGAKFTGTVPPAVAVTQDAEKRSAAARLPTAGIGEDVQSLREIILYGLKGMAAYAHHARVLGETDETVDAFTHKALAALADETTGADTLLGLAMELGSANLACMETLDRAHTARFGDPVPTPVNLGVRKGPAIIVSGHDLDDLLQLLEQTAGKGINVYTHSEMLPAHGYPRLKKYPHLAGHFGTAWQNQQEEFNGIPAAILMTTNCLQEPRPSYRDRIFTTGTVGWPHVAHIPENGGRKDFSKVIAKAIELKGFPADRADKSIMTGFGHAALLGAAETIIGAVKSGALRHFFLIGGCDGAKPGRNYYTEFAAQVPKDCVILTLACGKFRFNRMDFGTLGTLPRLIDVGQCNDAYSAIKVAAALAEAFKVSVNELPLSLVLSWYEQKAVAILLTLLSLGIKNIRLGPSLPAFISGGVLNVLVEKFGIKPITTPEKDLAEILGGERTGAAA